MSNPIGTSRSSKIDNAPTPHNTPASVLKDSYLKKQHQQQDDDYDQSQSLSRINEKLEHLNVDELDEEAEFERLPKSVNNRILALKSVQSGLFELEKNFQLEMLELEQKYLQKYAPLHHHRYELIVGKVQPTPEEIKDGQSLEGETEEDFADDSEEIVGIPCFWLTALENLPLVSQNITERDCEVLNYLSNIILTYLTEGKPGFSLTFVFDEENEFFTNKTLTKTYYYQSELGYSGDFIYDHASGEEINWTSNELNVTILVEKRKQKNKSTKQTRTIEKITPIESFFNFFDPPHALASENEQEQDIDEDELADLESRLAVDYALGEEIKDKLIPRAVDWFTGSALEFEYGGDEDDEDIETEDDDIDEEDEEQDDFAATRSPLQNQQPPECKQS